MRLMLLIGMIGLLIEPSRAMEAASAACRLFVSGVMPGLFPYMVLSLMLLSRLPERLPPFALILIGWCGGSPTGAKLLQLESGLPVRQRRSVAVACATMSPMFLLGTLGGWLNSGKAGVVMLLAVLLGGGLTGWLAGCFFRGKAAASAQKSTVQTLSLGEAVEQAARTMLIVCGTMVMLRVFAMPLQGLLPAVTLLEVTTGAEQIARLPLPLMLRTAMLAGASGFGGLAIILQNRAFYGKDLLSLPAQIAWQAVHGGISFLLALGMMLLT